MAQPQIPAQISSETEIDTVLQGQAGIENMRNVNNRNNSYATGNSRPHCRTHRQSCNDIGNLAPESNVEVITSSQVHGCGLLCKYPLKPYEAVFVEAPLLQFMQGEDVDSVVEDCLTSEQKEAFFQLQDTCSSSNLLEQCSEGYESADESAVSRTRTSTRSSSTVSTIQPVSVSAATHTSESSFSEISSTSPRSDNSSIPETDSADLPDVKTPMGVCQTNALRLDDRLFAVLNYASRINHSCNPNLSYRYDESRGTVEFYTLRHVNAGEELCVSYVDQSLPRDARRAMLHERYGFTCSCEVCSLEGEALADSEQRRERLATTDSDIFQAIERQEHEMALNLIDERLALLHQETALSTPLLLLRTEYDALRVNEELESFDGMRKWIDLVMLHAGIAHGLTSPIMAQLQNKQNEIRLQEELSLFC